MHHTTFFFVGARPPRDLVSTGGSTPANLVSSNNLAMAGVDPSAEDSAELAAGVDPSAEDSAEPAPDGN